MTNTLLKTAQNFSHAYDKAVKEVKPACLEEVKSQKSEVKSNHLRSKGQDSKSNPANAQKELLIFDLPLLTSDPLPCNVCPLSLTPENCHSRVAIALLIEEELTTKNNAKKEEKR